MSLPSSFPIQPHFFQEVVELITSVTSPTQSTEFLQRANLQLQDYAKNPDFNHYLIRIVTFNVNEAHDRGLVQGRPQVTSQILDTTKQLAFVLLKNNVKKAFSRMSLDLQKSIKQFAIGRAFLIAKESITFIIIIIRVQLFYLRLILCASRMF